MVDEKYGVAITETLHYLKGISQNDVNKIPNKLMNFLKENSLQNYKCDFDYTKPLNELNLTNETKGLIGLICLNYWCETEEQKNNFKKTLTQNENQYQAELMKKYNPDDIFENNTKTKVVESETTSNTLNENITQNTEITEIKENIFQKIMKKIKMFFKKK